MSKISRHVGRLLEIVSMALTVFIFANAQSVGGTIDGNITDQNGSLVPGAQITIVQKGTATKRHIITNNEGRFTAPNLPSGIYEITVSANGFLTNIAQNIIVEIGQEIAINFQLKIGDVKTSVVVEADQVQVATNSSILSNVLNGRTVQELPINGRDWTQLAALEPGVHTIEAQSGITVGGSARGNRGWGTQLAIGGNRPQQNNYRLDGISINDYSGGGPGGVLASVLGVDAIQEFSVVTGNASADFGKTSGGVINAVTRAGQNKFHGSLFEFHRNSALDAANFFDNANVIKKPQFKRHQFGGSVGGPLPFFNFGEGGPVFTKNDTFFFFAYEGLRQSLGATSTITVPSRAARVGQLSTGNITVSPSVIPYLSLYPLANGTETGDTGNYSFAANAISKEDFWTTRIDHKISDNDNLHGTYMWDNSDTKGPDGTNFAYVGQISNRRMFSIEETHIFSQNLINIARFGWSNSVSVAPINLGSVDQRASDTSLGFLPGQTVGILQVTGLSTFEGGTGAIGKFDNHYNSYQAYDDLILSHGSHNLKFGASIEKTNYNVFGVNSPAGLFAFGSLSRFLQNRPTSFSAQIPNAAPTIKLRQKIFGLYLQDDYRIASNLTLNLGLRYEPATVPTEANNLLSNLADIRAPLPRLGSPYFSNPTNKNFSPRLGFVWDPFKSGKTAIRGGYGIYDSLPSSYLFELLAVNTAPYFLSGSVSLCPATGTCTAAQGLGSFPTSAFPRLTPANLRYSYIEPNPKRSYVQQWNLNVQRQLPFGVVVNVGYTGQHGVHQPFRTNDANIVLPTVAADGGLVWPVPAAPASAKVNPNVGVINALAWLGSNTYHGMNVGVNRQTKALRLGLSYTWSKSIDLSSSSVAGTNFNNSMIVPLLFFPRYMRGLSDFDVRHNLSINYLWQVPGTKGNNKAAKWVTNGWQLGGILRVATGLPFTTLVGGDSLGMRNAGFNFTDRLNTPECQNPINPGNPDKYIKVECFPRPAAGRLGNAGRNFLIGPGIKTVDLSLFKNNHIGEKVNIQFRAEIFNAFNHANFSVPDRTLAQVIYSVNGTTPLSTAGQIKTTSTTSRQIQFAMKLLF